jgi:DNA repair protein RecO (recombination protein O)
VALLLTDAIVLQAFAYGETSRIVRLLTREAGVQSAIARGAARPRSRFAVLEPFAQGVASLYVKPSRDLQTLGGFDLYRARQTLGADLVRFGAACLVAEVVIRTGSEEAHPELFDGVAVGLDRLLAAPPGARESTALSVAWSVIATLGYGPQTEACVACGELVQPESPASFDYAAGGIRCPDCAAGLPGRVLPPHARQALAAFALGEDVQVDVTGGHWRLLSRYLEHHIVDGAPLRSLQFLSHALNAS